MTNYIFRNYNEKIGIGKIICLARTYQKHAKEMKTSVPEDPLLFLKPESSVIFNNESIIIPKMSSCLHHEVELAFVIGKDGNVVSKSLEAFNKDKVIEEINKAI